MADEKENPTQPGGAKDGGHAEPPEPDPKLVSWVTRDRGSHPDTREDVPDGKGDDNQ
jgi:hypothetical protein